MHANGFQAFRQSYRSQFTTIIKSTSTNTVHHIIMSVILHRLGNHHITRITNISTYHHRLTIDDIIINAIFLELIGLHLKKSEKNEP